MKLFLLHVVCWKFQYQKSEFTRFEQRKQDDCWCHKCSGCRCHKEKMSSITIAIATHTHTHTNTHKHTKWDKHHIHCQILLHATKQNWLTPTESCLRLPSSWGVPHPRRIHPHSQQEMLPRSEWQTYDTEQTFTIILSEVILTLCLCLCLGKYCVSNCLCSHGGVERAMALEGWWVRILSLPLLLKPGQGVALPMKPPHLHPLNTPLSLLQAPRHLPVPRRPPSGSEGPRSRGGAVVGGVLRRARPSGGLGGGLGGGHRADQPYMAGMELGCDSTTQTLFWVRVGAACVHHSWRLVFLSKGV